MIFPDDFVFFQSLTDSKMTDCRAVYLLFYFKQDSFSESSDQKLLNFKDIQSQLCSDRDTENGHNHALLTG